MPRDVLAEAVVLPLIRTKLSGNFSDLCRIVSTASYAERTHGLLSISSVQMLQLQGIQATARLAAVALQPFPCGSWHQSWTSARASYLGYSPKRSDWDLSRFARLTRIENIVALRNAGLSWAQISYTANMSDQAHLVQESRASWVKHPFIFLATKQFGCWNVERCEFRHTAPVIGHRKDHFPSVDGHSFLRQILRCQVAALPSPRVVSPRVAKSRAAITSS